jgi:hypothetical protein
MHGTYETNNGRAMNGDDVTAFYAEMNNHGIEIWLDGWGVGLDLPEKHSHQNI